jgi:hypothetical protein
MLTVTVHRGVEPGSIEQGIQGESRLLKKLESNIFSDPSNLIKVESFDFYSSL